MQGSTVTQGVAERLAQLVLDLRTSPLAEEDRLTVRKHLLDSLGVAFIGSRAEVFTDLLGDSSLAGSASVENAGMVLAYAINGSVFEDGSREGACHPAAVIMPVVLAMAEGKSWDLVDRAVIAGYDVMIRLARCGNPQFARKGFHGTAITAPFGAAAAAAQLLGLDLEATRNALCIAAMGGSGLMASFKCGSTQPLQVAWGVRNGITAALLAQKGHAGYPAIIESGFLPAYLGSDAAETIFNPLEKGFAIRGCYLKPFPGCRHMHASLYAFSELLEAQGIDPRDIARVEVGTYRIAIETEIHDVRKRMDAYFNIPYAIAARAVLGRSDHDAFDERHFGNEALNAFRKKVSLAIDPEIEGAYPRQRGSRVEIHLTDGRSWSHAVQYPLGEPENPLSVEDTTEKFRSNARRFLTSEQLSALEQVMDVTSAGTMNVNIMSRL